MEAIYKEINEQLNNGQKLTADHLACLAEIYIKENHLEDYVKHLDISDGMICHGEYDNLNMRLSLSPETSYNDRMKDIGINRNDYKVNEKIYKMDEFRNWYLKQFIYPQYIMRELTIRVLHVLYHELVHAKQNYIRYEGNNNIKEILDNEKVLMQNNYSAYLDFHDNFIAEYNANVEGYLEVHRLFERKLNDIKAKEILLNARKYFINQYKEKDNTVLSPYEWMHLIFRVDKVDTNNLDIKDRLLYGLPIEKAVYEDIKNMSITHYKKK